MKTTEMVITEAGFARAAEELDRLKTTGRREIVERIQSALATDSNAAESADYLDAREHQGRLELRIALLEQRLASARIAEPDGGNDVLDVGERVRVRDLDTGEELELELVGTLEADPDEGRVSVESPVGRALLGRCTGDVAVAQAPKGELRFEILAIEAPTGPPRSRRRR